MTGEDDDRQGTGVAQRCGRTIIGSVTDLWDDGEWLDVEVDDQYEEPPAPPPWRRRVITAVGVLVAVAMLAGPVWNVIDGATPQVSDSGLELCGFDYCIVQDAVREAGQDLTMSRLANSFLDEEGASALADSLVAYLGVAPVTVEVVDRIDRRIAGQYNPATRHILLERPARAWIVLHEVAHTVATGHGADFQATLVDLAEHTASTGG